MRTKAQLQVILTEQRRLYKNADARRWRASDKMQEARNAARKRCKECGTINWGAQNRAAEPDSTKYDLESDLCYKYSNNIWVIERWFTILADYNQGCGELDL